MSFDYISKCLSGINVTSIKMFDKYQNEILNSDPNKNQLLNMIETSNYQFDQNKRIGAACNYAEICLGNIGEKFRNALKTNWLAQNIISKELKYFPVNKSFFDDIAEDETIKLPSSNSMYLEFHFILKTPWHSSSEDEFGPIENMCTRDMITGKPCVRPSSWKGNLRSFLEIEEPGEKDRILKLFGSEKEKTTEENAIAGRLKFYQTNFNSIGGEVFSPHDRKNRTSENIVPVETVPAKTSGVLKVLYFPFDISEKTDVEKCNIIKGDITLILKNIKTFFNDYGFSAKESNSWGLADLNTIKIYPGKAISIMENQYVIKQVKIDERLYENAAIKNIVEILPTELSDSKESLKKMNWVEEFNIEKTLKPPEIKSKIIAYLKSKSKISRSKKKYLTEDVALKIYEKYRSQEFQEWLQLNRIHTENSFSCYEIKNLTNIENLIKDNLEVI